LNKANHAQLLCVLFALIGIGIVSLLIARYDEPALRSLVAKIGTVMNPDAKKQALETW
jgi:hypothetical protein